MLVNFARFTNQEIASDHLIIGSQDHEGFMKATGFGESEWYATEMSAGSPAAAFHDTADFHFITFQFVLVCLVKYSEDEVALIKARIFNRRACADRFSIAKLISSTL